MLPSALSSPLGILQQTVTQTLSAQAVGALRSLASPSTDPSFCQVSILAEKILRLHRMGLPVSPEIRHLLEVASRVEEGPVLGEADPSLLLAVRDGMEPREPQETFVPPSGPPLRLYLHPEIWRPGNWTRIFSESLLSEEGRRQVRGRRGIELGTGSGVLAISLILAGAARMVGLDLNPHAPVVASLNAYWNLRDPDSRDPRRLLFVQSDLLDAVDIGLRCDFVVGCLPQVVQRTDFRGELRRLGDAYAGTGEVEDLFGLGLLARALRHAHLHLDEGGWVEFIMAGRPGREVLLDFYRRQGYHPEIVHQARIPQDPDPPMESFVRMEEEGGVRFEFYVPDREGPVSAREASRYPREQVSHDLYVIRGVPYRWFERRGLRETLRDSQGRIGYTEDPGSEWGKLREEIAHHYQRTTGIRVKPETVFVGPSAQELFGNLLKAVVPEGDTVLFSQRNWDRFARVRESLSFHRHLSSGDRLGEVAAAIREHHPRLVIFNLTHLDREDQGELEEVAAAALENETRLVVAGLFHQQAPDGSYPLARLLEKRPEVVPQLVILNDLSRRWALSTTHLSYAIVPDRSLYEALARLGEVGYSRASTVGQQTALRLLQQVRPSSGETGGGPEISLVEGTLPRPPRHPDPIRMEFGQSERPLPPDFLRAVERLVDRMGVSDLEEEALQAARRYLRESRGVKGVEVVAGAGVLPLQAAAIQGIARRTGQRIPVLMPCPTYDVHRPMQAQAGGFFVGLKTEKTKIPPYPLEGFGRGSVPHLLLLTQPTNPGGQFYTEEELLALSEAAPDLIVLSDEVFGLLSLSRQRLVSPARLSSRWTRVITFFGLSKEVGEAGGFRAGFAATSDPELAQAIREERLTPADPVALAGAAVYFRHWRRFLEGHRHYLRTRKNMWEKALHSFRIPYLPSQGGYGTLVDFSRLYGRTFRGTPITRDNLAELLDEGAGLIVRPPGWGETEGVRMIYAIDRLPEAVRRLRAFLTEVGWIS